MNVQQGNQGRRSAEIPITNPATKRSRARRQRELVLASLVRCPEAPSPGKASRESR